jgi:hypothetical protein
MFLIRLRRQFDKPFREEIRSATQNSSLAEQWMASTLHRPTQSVDAIIVG